MEQSDEELMCAYEKGSQEAIEMIFQRYKKPVFNFALRMLANRADAEDVTSDVFLVLFSKRYQPQSGTKFTTWLFAVTRNRCIDRIRKGRHVFSAWFKNQETDTYEPWDIEDDSSVPDEQAQEKEQVQLVHKAIMQIPVNQREALVLREFQQLSYEEIAKVLNCSLSNVKVLIFRAREAVRQQMESYRKEDFT